MSDSPPASPSPSPARTPQARTPQARAPQAGAPQAADGHGGLRVLAVGAVAFGVLLLAAAAFVLSYAGIHAIALSAGVSPRLARIYPVIFDAMLVVTCAAVLSLRGAGLPSRTYAWLSMLALLAAAAAADALNATATKLPRRPAAATAAVIPWALVLIGFGLLLCMLRQGRLRRAATAAAAAAAGPEDIPQPSGHVAVRGMTVTRPAPSTSNREATARIVLDQPEAAADLPHAETAADLPHARAAADLPHAEAAAEHASDLAIDAEPGQDDPASDEARPAEQPEFAQAPGRRAREEQPAGYGGRSASVFSPAPTLPQVIDPEADEATPSNATDPEPGTSSDEHHDPDPVTVGSDVKPNPEAGADPDTQPGPQAEPSLQTEPDPDLERILEAGPYPDAEPSLQGEPDPEAESEVASAAQTPADAEGTDADVLPEAQPVPATPQFDRKRSSPVPPQA
jgi:hypothetical protein